MTNNNSSIASSATATATATAAVGDKTTGANTSSSREQQQQQLAPGETRRSSFTRNNSLSVHEVFATPAMAVTAFTASAAVSGLTATHGEYSTNNSPTTAAATDFSTSLSVPASSAMMSSGAQQQTYSSSECVANQGDRRPSEATTISTLTYRSHTTRNASSTTAPRSTTDSGDGTATPGKVTFAGQTNLHPLPVPKLEDTLDRLVQILEPLQTSQQEKEESRQIVQEFLQGEGPILQDLLVQYDQQGRESGHIGSYVEEFWNDSYLAPDASVVLNLNPFFVLEDSPDPKLDQDPIRRAASLCFASVKLASQVRHETLRPDTQRGKPLCMDQFKALFGASRTPVQGAKDSIYVFDGSSHVVVMCRSQMYYFQVLWPEGHVAVDEGDLVDVLAAIQSHAHQGDDETKESTTAESKKDADEQRYMRVSKTAIGVLTSLSRTEWAAARDELWTCPQNRESLEIIDSALFVLVLDDYIPTSKPDAAANMLHGSYQVKTSKKDFMDYQVGSCCNRWYDKLQIIVCGDGTAGINFEHSAIDGHTALRFVSDVYAETVVSFAQSIVKMVQAHNPVSSVIEARVQRAAVTLDATGRATLDVFPKKINFDLPESIQQKIYYAETALGDEIVATDMYTLEYKTYGKAFIKNNSMSPDSYVQMSMMLAYYKLYGRLVCTYEPVLTKAFYHGRTEAMRSATMEAKDVCEVFCDPRSTADAKLAALQKQTQVHSSLVKECSNGKGVDRHLFALKSIAQKYQRPIPSFFLSAPWKKLNHTVLSTSNCGNPSLAQFGFGPVVPDGLGIGYIIKENCIHFSIASKHRQTTRYAHTLDSVLSEMADLMIPARGAAVTDEQLRPQGRTGLRSISMDQISYDSYGDIWGESANAPLSLDPDSHNISTVHEDSVEEQSYSEHTPPPPRRWKAEETEIVETDEEEEEEEETIQIRATDGPGDTSENSAVPRPKMKRRGSKDLVPTIPGRRSSIFGLQGTTSFEYKDLSKKGNPIDFKSDHSRASQLSARGETPGTADETTNKQKE